MEIPELHIASEIMDDGIENLWVTGESTVILLHIDVATGTVRGFSCRAAPGMVVEMGGSRDAVTGHSYPGLSIYMTREDQTVSERWSCTKAETEWHLERDWDG